ncbi:hypothetical protein K7X08_022337 [Anisodus acutangulus]|uniref:YTH domain-containing family protein n=1 Tax=Anisodus acutangulus TaxID=402998 RepID=A0A9Q1MMV7_9SOLA|nr:hypothetical protein K7X08_022337 [Anisodus acutangulus]
MLQDFKAFSHIKKNCTDQHNLLPSSISDNESKIMIDCEVQFMRRIEIVESALQLIQGTEANLQITSPLLQSFQAMYNEGAPEFVVDQGLYYPPATNYGYFCTGLESPGDWDGHQRFFGLDGQDIQYMDAQTESFPYVYYTPNYGYAESSYNPYNPYIPGAVVGVDGPCTGPQHYYTIPPYENLGSPSYLPMVAPSSSGILANPADPIMGSVISSTNRADDHRLKRNLSSTSPIFTPTSLGPASGYKSASNRGSESANINAASSKQHVSHVFSSPSSQVHPGKVVQAIGSIIHGKALSNHGQLRAHPPSEIDLSDLRSGAHERTNTDKVRPKFLNGIAPSDGKVSPDMLTEQNRGPRNDKTKKQLVVKAYTTRAGNVDVQGNIVIHADEYNRGDFLIDFGNTKFFVIKSYSEDDVHKSIKYNVWSSTPNGNKKLNSAYEDSQRIAAGNPRACPIFLFFSVNASGQFCGVAEMTGPVDFYKDMDFWQQDKWSGSFPVKWHFIKDVPNPNFRHIILENNENKPVTNSRDTQEIRYKKGIEMLKVFKDYASKTSLLDDFMYYENRQEVLQEEKAKLLFRSYESPFFMPVLDPPRKLNSSFGLPSGDSEKISKRSEQQQSGNGVAVPAELDSIGSKSNKENANNGDKLVADGGPHVDSALKIGSLTINPKPSKAQPLDVHSTSNTVASTQSVDVVTVGSMPVKVNGHAESSGFLTIGTIPLDPRAFQRDEAGGSGKTVLK